MGEVLAPLLSEWDPPLTSEGSLDPLGLYAIADSLALKLVPGVRERMSRPRYLTLIALGQVVTSEHPHEEVVAADGVSPPWQVYEWLVVEGLVRTEGESRTRGLPGSDKARSITRRGGHLSARTYLKAPATFGFHGVYRLLASELDVLTHQSSTLGEVGHQLLAAWQKEYGLHGFYLHDGDLGKEVAGRFRKALGSAMKDGGVSDHTPPKLWKDIRRFLDPDELSPAEREVIRGALQTSEEGHRGEVLGFMVSEEGKEYLGDGASERAFHRALHDAAGVDLRSLLEAIDTYESFTRHLQGSFDGCLHFMTQRGARVRPAELSGSEGVKAAVEQTPRLYARNSELLGPFGESNRFQQLFSAFADPIPPDDWIQVLLEHHIKTQSRKPPNGKAPWFWRYDDGTLSVRAAYRREEGGRHDDEYVHTYRTNPLKSFCRDLGLIES